MDTESSIMVIWISIRARHRVKRFAIFCVMLFFLCMKKRKEMMAITDKMGDATPEELEVLLEEMGEIQERLDIGDFYLLDVKIEEMGNGLRLECHWFRS